MSVSKYFTKQYNLYFGNYLDAPDNIQSAGRVRHCDDFVVDRYFWFMLGGARKQPETQKAILDNHVRNLGIKVTKGEDYDSKVYGIPFNLETAANNGVAVVDEDLPTLRLALTIEQRSNLTKNSIIHMTKALLELEGYDLEDLVLEGGDDTEIKEEAKEIRAYLKKLPILQKLEAKDVTDEELEKLKEISKTKPSLEISLMILKAKMKRDLGLEWDAPVSEEEATFHHKYQKPIFLRAILKDEDFAKNTDARYSEFKNVVTMGQYRNLVEARQLAIDKGIESYIGRTGIIDPSEVEALDTALRASANKVKSLLGVDVHKSGRSKPVKKFLEIFGIKTSTKKISINGKKINVMVLDDVTNEAIDLVVNRVAAIQEAKDQAFQDAKVKEARQSVTLQQNQSVGLWTNNKLKLGYEFLDVVDNEYSKNSGNRSMGVSYYPTVRILQVETNKEFKVSYGDISNQLIDNSIDF